MITQLTKFEIVHDGDEIELHIYYPNIQQDQRYSMSIVCEQSPPVWSINLDLMKGIYYYYYVVKTHPDHVNEIIDENQPTCGIINSNHKMNFIHIIDSVDKYDVTHLTLPVKSLCNIKVQTYSLIYSGNIKSENDANRLDKWLYNQPVRYRIVISNVNWSFERSHPIILINDSINIESLFEIYGLSSTTATISKNYTAIISHPTVNVMNFSEMIKKYPPKYLLSSTLFSKWDLNIPIYQQTYDIYHFK